MVTGWLGRGVANKLARDGASAGSTTSSRSGFGVNAETPSGLPD